MPVRLGDWPSSNRHTRRYFSRAGAQREVALAWTRDKYTSRTGIMLCRLGVVNCRGGDRLRISSTAATGSRKGVHESTWLGKSESCLLRTGDRQCSSNTCCPDCMNRRSLGTQTRLSTASHAEPAQTAGYNAQIGLGTLWRVDSRRTGHQKTPSSLVILRSTGRSTQHKRETTGARRQDAVSVPG